MINVKRDPSYADKLRSYKVVLDGGVIGKVAEGQSKSFDVKPGAHTLYVKIDWARSNKITFESTADKEINFRCVNSLRGGRFFLAVIYAVFLPHKYIKLELTD
jgi:hypothetical protein